MLGPERLYRRPVIDEHDFHCGRYLDDQKEPIEVRVEAVLTDLPQEAELRFHRHLRRWDDITRDFAGAELFKAALALEAACFEKHVGKPSELQSIEAKTILGLISDYPGLKRIDVLGSASITCEAST